MKEKRPQISIIVPVFNKARYLEKTLETISNQSFHDFECILVDDGSNDGSDLICDRQQHNDDRFMVYHTENYGVSHARNVGLDNACGEYVVFVDGDDEIDPEYLSNLIGLKEKNKADMVISWICNIDENGLLQYRDFPIECGLYHFGDIVQSFADLQLKSGLFGWCVSKIIPLKLAREIRFNEDLKLAEDLDFYLRIYRKISTLYLDDSAYYHYRQNTENSSVKEDDDIDYISQLSLMLRVRDFLIVKNAWEGENRNKIESKISDYVYFSLFHCPINRFEKRFEEVYSLWMKTDLRGNDSTGFKKMVLSSVQKKNVKKTKILISLYRLCRKALKGNG